MDGRRARAVDRRCRARDPADHKGVVRRAGGKAVVRVLHGHGCGPRDGSRVHGHGGRGRAGLQPPHAGVRVARQVGKRARLYVQGGVSGRAGARGGSQRGGHRGRVVRRHAHDDAVRGGACRGDDRCGLGGSQGAEPHGPRRLCGGRIPRRRADRNPGHVDRAHADVLVDGDRDYAGAQVHDRGRRVYPGRRAVGEDEHVQARRGAQRV